MPIHIGRPLQKIKNIRWSIRVAAEKYKIVEKLGNDMHPKLKSIFFVRKIVFYRIDDIKKSSKLKKCNRKSLTRESKVNT